MSVLFFRFDIWGPSKAAVFMGSYQWMGQVEGCLGGCSTDVWGNHPAGHGWDDENEYELHRKEEKELGHKGVVEACSVHSSVLCCGKWHGDCGFAGYLL